jgi:hypothetical protein
MLSKVIAVKGSLTPANRESTLEPRTLLRIGFGTKGLSKAFNGSRLTKDTTIEIDSSVKVADGRRSAMLFIENLKGFIQTDGNDVLNPEGSFMVTFETDEEPVTIRVIVHGGKVTYQEARLVWDSEETA